MKKCPYCAEDIQDDAIKCKHCGEWMDQRNQSSNLESKDPIWLSVIKVTGKVLREITPLAETISDIVNRGHDLQHEFYSQVDVKIEYVHDFITATKANRDAALLERGNMKYEIYQSEYDPTKFILYEIYKSVDAAEKDHKSTLHYQRWKQDVEPMMAKPRTRQNTGIPSGYKRIA